ncbi:ComEC/Rec2 family competence protein [Mycoplasmopsis ciconiae]|uniref:ComEC/Rec2 family competence protein n=1 Tax=Mycoplasmopsis ciconiae TaxID=561067 RepID=A0ABU7MLX7_9BACT|nr:ComEC/Rec2 family competence protein [Mycoplasmopsis ciconiae]
MIYLVAFIGIVLLYFLWNTLYFNVAESSKVQNQNVYVYQAIDNNKYVWMNNKMYLIKDSTDEFKVGYFYKINGYISTIKSQYISNYYANKIVAFINVDTSVKIGTFFNVKRYLDEFFINAPNIYKKYLFALIFGYGHESDLISKAKDLNIVHLIVVSGFHFNILFSFIYFIMKKIKVFKANWVAFIIVFIYYIFVYKNVASFRAICFIFVSNILLHNKFNNNKLFTQKIISVFIIALVYLLFNPYGIYKVGFYYSFGITFVILLVNQQKSWSIFIKWKWLFYLYSSVILYITSLFITLSINTKINALAFLYILIFSPIVELSILITFFTFYWYWFNNFYYSLIEKILDLAVDYSIFIEWNNKIQYFISFYLFYCFMWISSYFVYLKNWTVYKNKKRV